jgi:hypothetical protein
MAFPQGFSAAAAYTPGKGYTNAHPEIPIGMGHNSTTYTLNGQPVSADQLTAMTQQPGFIPGGQMPSTVPGTPNFPNYAAPGAARETPDANTSSAPSVSVPAQMQDFSQWLNQIMGQQFPYGAGQGGGGSMSLIPSPTS